jgi:hypothetical protein
MKGPITYYEIKEMYGTDLSSTKLATELRDFILEEILLGFNVEIDFKDVRSVTNGWARNAFGVIVNKHGEKFFKDHVFMTNISDHVKKSLLEGVYESFATET